MKYLNYDEKTGAILGWFDKEIHTRVVTKVKNKDGEEEEVVTNDTTKLPKPLKEVTDEEWKQAINSSANFYDVDKNIFGIKDFREDTQKIKDIRKRLINLCDYKYRGAKNLVLGYKNTQDQIERYKDKYDRALRVKKDIDAGKTPQEQNKDIVKNYQIIIKKHIGAKKAIEKFLDLVELYRSKVEDIIKSGDLEKAEKLIEVGQNFNEKTSIKDIKKLFL